MQEVGITQPPESLDTPEVALAQALSGRPEISIVEPPQRLGPLSWVARRGKVDFFLPWLPKSGVILDIGCGDNWFKNAAAERGCSNVFGLDLRASADIVGDLTEWKALGLRDHSIDAIVAFEFVEHGDFARVLHELLKPDGRLIVTTPIPRMDPVCRALEALRLLQRRTSPHSNLVDLRHYPGFEVIVRETRACVSQWAVLRPV